MTEQTEQPAEKIEEMVLTADEAFRVAEKIPGVRVDRSTLATAAAAHARKADEDEAAAFNALSAEIGELNRSPIVNAARLRELKTAINERCGAFMERRGIKPYKIF